MCFQVQGILRLNVTKPFTGGYITEVKTVSLLILQEVILQSTAGTTYEESR